MAYVSSEQRTQTFDLVNRYKTSQLSNAIEKCFSLTQRHFGRKLCLFVVLAKICNLIQLAGIVSVF